MSARRPYLRSMNGGWKRDPYFVRYMMREATALFVVAYALLLLAGVVRLAQGEAAFNGWLEALRSPWSLAFHVFLLAVFVYHTWIWFCIMPKTMPMILKNGKRLRPALITGAGLALAAVLCVALFLAVRGWRNEALKRSDFLVAIRRGRNARGADRPGAGIHHRHCRTTRLAAAARVDELPEL